MRGFHETFYGKTQLPPFYRGYGVGYPISLINMGMGPSTWSTPPRDANGRHRPCPAGAHLGQLRRQSAGELLVTRRSGVLRADRHFCSGPDKQEPRGDRHSSVRGHFFSVSFFGLKADSPDPLDSRRADATGRSARLVEGGLPCKAGHPNRFSPRGWRLPRPNSKNPLEGFDSRAFCHKCDLTKPITEPKI